MMRDIENPMVVDAYWHDHISEPVSEGYVNRTNDVYVMVENALAYAVERLESDEYTKERFLECVTEIFYEEPELGNRFVEWFYADWERVGD